MIRFSYRGMQMEFCAEEVPTCLDDHLRLIDRYLDGLDAALHEALVDAGTILALTGRRASINMVLQWEGSPQEVEPYRKALDHGVELAKELVNASQVRAFFEEIGKL